MQKDKTSRRGPPLLSVADKRTHCVSVRLNAAELAHLDTNRGKFQRGEWFRMAALDQLAPTVPSANRDAWLELSRLASNLNQAQASVNRGDVSGYPESIFENLRTAVAELRLDLIGAKR
jgi:hypothetical protein